MRIATIMEMKKYNNTKSTEPTEKEARLLASQAHCLFYIFEDCVFRNDVAGARYAAVQVTDQLYHFRQCGIVLKTRFDCLGYTMSFALYPVYAIKLARQAVYMLDGRASSMFAMLACFIFARCLLSRVNGV